MDNLDMAKEVFYQEKWSLVVVNKGKIISKKNKSRLLPLIKTMEQFKEKVRGGTVADKVVGRAAAMIMVAYGIAEVFTPLISEGGKNILREASIYVEAEKTVPVILNEHRKKPCPMEKMVSEIEDPVSGKNLLMKFFREKGLI